MVLYYSLQLLWEVTDLSCFTVLPSCTLTRPPLLTPGDSGGTSHILRHALWRRDCLCNKETPFLLDLGRDSFSPESF